MHSPEILRQKLVRQWHNAHWREKRLLSEEAWPLELSIGRPDGVLLENNPAQLWQHVESWRQVKGGSVVWKAQRYRNASEAIELPHQWVIECPSDWVHACADLQVADDYELLSHLIAQTDPLFHTLLIRQLLQIRKLPEAEILQAVQVALQLQPGIAQGKPLRALSIAGTDSKFFERHRRLLIRLLDLRFAGEVGEQGLERFLGAVSEKDHWLLLAALQPGLLPFQQMRVRASELMQAPLPAQRILVVENEQCLHQLPPLADCIVILGAGLNLNWLQAEWLADRHLAYWGDLDSWGLAMLSKARTFLPHIQPLMMERTVFEQFEKCAVVEPVPYQGEELQALTKQELVLFDHLQQCEKGRLEQEFLSTEWVENAVQKWIRDIETAM